MRIWYSAKMKILNQERFIKFLWPLVLAAACIGGADVARGQQAATAPPATGADGTANAEFAAAADEVLEQMSEITGLKLRTPLKKSLRSREEIRAYVIKQMDEDKNPAERYAGQRSAEAFGLIPKGFDLDTFMVDLLTEQIAGLYDPKAHEFYIADWIPLADQRMVMAHELTHALEDQHFQIEDWVKAARPNDDAELAREAVLEGSAMAAMVDFLLRGTGSSLRDLPDFDPSMLVGDLADSPTLQKAPRFIKDTLIFPYFAGLNFSTAILKPSGWSGLPGVFAKPPVSTQQILHPALYRSGKMATHVTLPSMEKLMGADWSKLEENTLGEFGWVEVLKQFLGDERAKPLSEAWDGDRYAVYEQKQTKRVLLVTRLRLTSEQVAIRFFGQYSEALEKKHDGRTNLFGRPNFFSFDTPGGGVFLNCVGAECITLEGGDRSLFLKLNKELDWGLVPEQPKELSPSPAKIAMRKESLLQFTFFPPTF
ncbi:MAG TPA: hypothetical protein VHF01_09435 [Candidatus Acidoferrum sp.]|nr:hypothetical protein [Candidatus Acidoferrum sp.]